MLYFCSIKGQYSLPPFLLQIAIDPTTMAYRHYYCYNMFYIVGFDLNTPSI